MNILFIGDVVGKIGRRALKDNLPQIRNKYDIDFIICNGENISNGRGINRNHYNFLVNELNIDSITLGNHYLDKKEELSLFIDNNDCVPPLNSKNELLKSSENNIYSRSRLYMVNGTNIRVTSVLGSVFMKEEVIEPIKAINEVLVNDDISDIHIIDFHAEANGEKQSICYYFLGEISALIGTHTHVQTNDLKIIDNKTIYISDVGMTGASDGILGFEYESVIKRNLLKQNVSMKLKDKGPYVLSAVVMRFNDDTFLPIEAIPLQIFKNV